MWTSIESLVTVAVILSVLGGLWIRYGGDSMKKTLCYSASLFLFTCRRWRSKGPGLIWQRWNSTDSR